ncbi:MAG: hypothetical protein ACKO8U_12365 [Pirellula sp.]
MDVLLDNIDDEESVKWIIREAKKLRRGVILITSRWGNWPLGFVNLELDVLPEESAIDFLVEATDTMRVSLDAELGQGTDRQFAKEIVGALGQLALGISQAAATINTCRWSFREYQVQWNVARDTLIEDPYFNPVNVGYPRSVGMTWLTTYQRLPRESQLVFDALCWLTPDPIPERLITKDWPKESLENLDKPLQELIETRLKKLMIPLYDFGLASSPAGTQRLFTVHKLVQEVGRIWQSKAAVDPVAKDLAMLLLDREFVREDNLDNIRLNILHELRPMALHARGLYDSNAANDSPYLASRAFRMLSEIAQAEGRYGDAENESTRSVNLARLTLNTHLSGEFNLAESLSILCQTLESRGYFDKALEVGQEQQRILEELCTKEPENLAHRRDLGIALNNVGRVLENKGDNDGALTLFSKSQAISEELCTKEPENLAHRRELGIACFWVGSALAKSHRWQESAGAFEQAIKATQEVIDAGGSFGSLKGDLDVMTSWLRHVRDQINEK